MLWQMCFHRQLCTILAIGIIVLCRGYNVHAQYPLSYQVSKTRIAPVIDGIPDTVWNKAAWSAAFIDIEGSKKPAPAFATNMKMLWNDTHLFILAYLEEPHLWGTLTEHDAIIYRDHDFEVFLDPRGDGLNYYEIEINVLGTVLDLFMDKPYKDKGNADLGWNASGLQKAVALHGTLNNNSDTDSGWTVELALPFTDLTYRGNAHQPKAGATWRINFSRVEWLMQPEGTSYTKQKQADGKHLPEQNWVWTPQGVIDMHRPEHWGLLHFVE